MLIKDTTVTLDWLLTKNPSFASHIEDYFDIQITAPDNTVTYLEGSANWATTFTQPSATVDGQLTYNYLFDQSGVYTILLGTGGSASFTILDTVLALIVDQDTIINKTLHLE